MAKGRGSHDAKSAKLVGPMPGTCGSRHFVGFSINMNDVSGIGSCAEKEHQSVGSLAKNFLNYLN